MTISSNAFNSSQPLRVAVYGFGVVGQGVVRLASSKTWLEVVQVVVRRDELNNTAAAEIVPEAAPTLRLTTDAENGLETSRPDVIVIATCSTLKEVLPQLRLAAKTGAAIACTAEELAFITPTDGPEAREIFSLADQHEVAIVALGLNPGFLMDVWPLSLASIAHDVASIDCVRIVDVSGFGPSVRSSLGIGYSPESFEAELRLGHISGHIGFRESLRLLGAAIDRPVDHVSVQTRPLVAKRNRSVHEGEISAGQTAGVQQVATGTTAGVDWLRFEATLTVALDELGAEPVDKVHIAGSTELTATISPGASSVAGTVARIVNSLPSVASAPAGVHSSLVLGLTPARFEPPAHRFRERD